jgi:membrane associated rhomboid family serine protease
MSSQQYSPMGFKLLPPVVKNILIINFLFFLATISLGQAFNIDLVDKLGLHFITSSSFKPYQFITYMFMHGGFSHVFFNMFAVWMFGYALENYWGPKRFLTYFLVTGIGAALVHYAIMYYWEISPVLTNINAFLSEPDLTKFKVFINSPDFRVVSVEVQNRFNEFSTAYNTLVLSDPDKALQLAIDFMVFYKQAFVSAPVVVGASGAVFGILLAFGMLFPNTLIFLYFFIPIKAKWFVVIYGLIELYTGITDKGSNVAHFAHLGGMLFGFILIKLWQRKPYNPY